MKLKTGYLKPSLKSEGVLINNGNDRNIDTILDNYGALTFINPITFTLPINGNILGNAATADRLNGNYVKSVNGYNGDVTLNFIESNDNRIAGWNNASSLLNYLNTYGTDNSTKSSTGNLYLVELDASGKLCVKVPTSSNVMTLDTNLTISSNVTKTFEGTVSINSLLVVNEIDIQNNITYCGRKVTFAQADVILDGQTVRKNVFICEDV